MVDCVKNLYEILGVSPNANLDEIKSAYKKLVRIYHPDVNKTKGAEIKFKLLNNAYDILSDENKRNNYNSILNAANANIKENFKPDKSSIIKKVKITKNEQTEGTTRTVNILNTQKCPRCLGKKFINGGICAFCLGEGEKKELQKIDVKINPGVQNGEFIYVGKVNKSALFDKKLFLKIEIEEAAKLNFEGNNIIINVEFPIFDLILGAKREINIPNIGLTQINIPPMTKPNSRIKLFNKFGANYFIQVKEIFPNAISNNEKALYLKLKKISAAN